MHEATAIIDSGVTVADIDRRLYGALVEHMGRCVYTGIFEPGHPKADERGFRTDVLDLVRELGATTIRYPGGNFVSGYCWEDGIGPVEERPVRLDLAWQATETNRFGLAEFMEWVRETGTEPMMAVNLGTRGVLDAARLVEYCNHPGGTALSDLRRKNGDADPFGIKLWCLGNEMDGPWQLGHTTATEYGRLAAQAGQAMKLVDPSIELVACGSSNAQMDTFGSWEREVLEQCYDEVDHLSLHSYYHPETSDLGGFLASAVGMDRFIEGVLSIADGVRARRNSKKRIQLSFDEWNVWYSDSFDGGHWDDAQPLAEDTYTAADAVVVGNLMMSLLRHADRVSVACLAQLVNVLAPIRTEAGGPAWKQTIFEPFAQTAAHARGAVLHTSLASPSYDAPTYGDVDVVDVLSTYDDDAGELALFAVNRDPAQAARLAVKLRDLAPSGPATHLSLTCEAPEPVGPDGEAAGATSRRLPYVDEVELAPGSWNLIRVPVRRG